IRLPSTLTSIKGSAFENCTSLTEVIIPAGITISDFDGFRSCSSLKQIVLPEGVSSLGIQAFLYCSGLEQVTLPQSLESIGYYAFGECTSLKEIEIPANVTYIGNIAFQGSTNLELVICRAVTPPELEMRPSMMDHDVMEENVFKKWGIIHPNLQIKVPVGSVAAYKAAWSDYAGIISAIE
ncbi:MAG: leucine-rich repeat domain-containing protein, partial [Treponema sp.]|nr:leucine-rich repeat domain-containing protein [Treponema sp.]